MDLSDKIVRSYSRSPDRLQQTAATHTQTQNYHKSPENTSRRPHNENTISIAADELSRRGHKSTNKLATMRRPNSPIVLNKSPHRNQSSKMLNIDLRSYKQKQQQREDMYNPLMELTTNPRRQEYLTEKSYRTVNEDVADHVRDNMLNYDFSRQYLKNPVSKDASRMRVEVEVDKLAQKSLKRFEYFN